MAPPSSLKDLSTLYKEFFENINFFWRDKLYNLLRENTEMTKACLEDRLQIGYRLARHFVISSSLTMLSMVQAIPASLGSWCLLCLSLL